MVIVSGIPHARQGHTWEALRESEARLPDQFAAIGAALEFPSKLDQVAACSPRTLSKPRTRLPALETHRTIAERDRRWRATDEAGLRAVKQLLRQASLPQRRRVPDNALLAEISHRLHLLKRRVARHRRLFGISATHSGTAGRLPQR